MQKEKEYRKKLVDYNSEHEKLLFEINQNINKEELDILLQLLGDNCVRKLNQSVKIDNNNDVIILDDSLYQVNGKREVDIKKESGNQGNYTQYLTF